LDETSCFCLLYLALLDTLFNTVSIPLSCADFLARYVDPANPASTIKIGFTSLLHKSKNDGATTTKELKRNAISAPIKLSAYPILPFTPFSAKYSLKSFP